MHAAIGTSSQRLITPCVRAAVAALGVSIAACQGVTFERVLGAPYPSPAASAAEQTPDGGYVLAGGGYTSGNGDWLLVVKTDENGSEQWTWAHQTAMHGGLSAIAQVEDGGFLTCGAHTVDLTDTQQAYLARIDASGASVWARTITAEPNSRCTRLKHTPDGGYLLMVVISASVPRGSDLYLERIDENGTILWSLPIPNEFANDIVPTPDGDYLLTSTWFDAVVGSGYQMEVWKRDAAGVEQWRKQFGAPDRDEFPASMALAPNGDVTVAGTATAGPDSRAVGLRIDAQGNPIWLHDVATSWSWGRSVGLTQDGGAIFTGYTRTTESGTQALLAKVDAFGHPTWQRHYGDDFPDYQTSGEAVQQIEPEGYMLAGWGWVDGEYGMVLVRTNADGLVSTPDP